MTAAKTHPRSRSRRNKAASESLLTASQIAELVTERVKGVVRTDAGWVILQATVDGESVRLEATRVDIEGSAADEIMRRDLKLSVPEAQAPADEASVDDAVAQTDPPEKLKRAG